VAQVFMDQMPFLTPRQQHQSTKRNSKALTLAPASGLASSFLHLPNYSLIEHGAPGRYIKRYHTNFILNTTGLLKEGALLPYPTSGPTSSFVHLLDPRRDIAAFT